MSFFTDEEWGKWFDCLSGESYLVIDNYLPEEIYRISRNYLISHFENDDFKKAGIGASTSHMVKDSVRGDFVYWLSRDKDVEFEQFFELADELKEKLNRYCYLSLSGYEFHLAHYPPGAHYEKHIDEFHGRNNRMISVVIYLNEHWKPGDGGELKIYLSDKEIIIEPISRRCVLFISDKVQHEVLTTKVSRYSLTGWLQHHPSILGHVMR